LKAKHEKEVKDAVDAQQRAEVISP